MPIYRLVPIARPDDQNWDIAINHGEVVVRAGSTGEARAVAMLAETRAAGGDPSKVTTQTRASAFADEKLYGVREDDSGEFPETGPAEVLRANFKFPPDYVLAPDD